MTDRATTLEIAALGRRAQNDPGAFVPRRRDEDYVGDYERMDRWQVRALDAAIDAFLATAPAPAAVTTPDRDALHTMRDAAVLAHHWWESRGMSWRTPDRCSCGVTTMPVSGDEEITARRARAFAGHLAEVLAEARSTAEGGEPE